LNGHFDYLSISGFDIKERKAFSTKILYILHWAINTILMPIIKSKNLFFVYIVDVSLYKDDSDANNIVPKVSIFFMFMRRFMKTV